MALQTHQSTTHHSRLIPDNTDMGFLEENILLEN